MILEHDKDFDWYLEEIPGDYYKTNKHWEVKNAIWVAGYQWRYVTKEFYNYKDAKKYFDKKKEEQNGMN